MIVDNGSREQLVIPAVYSGIAGVSGRMTNNDVAQEAGFFITNHQNIQLHEIPDETPITLRGEPYRVVAAASHQNNNHTFISLRIRPDIEPRQAHPAAKILDSSTIESIARFICENKYGQKPRDALQIDRFLASSGVPRFHCNTPDRYQWLVTSLMQCTPDEIIKIILRLGSPVEYQSDTTAQYDSISELNRFLRIEGLQILNEGYTTSIKRTDAIELSGLSIPSSPYIDNEIIAKISSLSSCEYSFLRLSEICRELNISWAGNAHMATAMLVRALVDHIPPLFGLSKFSEVANNYSGSVSFKKHMKILNESSRQIADGSLHTHIRKSESIPMAVDVDFRSAISELLREIIRITPNSS